MIDLPVPRPTADDAVAAVRGLVEERERLLILTDRLLGLVLDVSDALLLAGEVPPDLRAALDAMAWEVREGALLIEPKGCGQ